MGRPTNDRIDAGFAKVRAIQRLNEHRDEYRDPDFWRRLNPHLTVRDMPFADVAPVVIGDDAARVCREQLGEEGFFVTPPVVDPGRMALMRRGITALAERAIPTVFACVYDEYYQLFQGLEPVFAPILGERYRWVAQGNWAFHVPPGDAGMSGLTSFDPHRDSLGPDPAVLAHELPSILAVWIPLTDVTPVDSCIYVVPSHTDRDYYTTIRDVSADRINLQDIRAVPAPAGAVLSWSTHLAHWGSRSSRLARGPRMAISMYFQRVDVPIFHAPSRIDPGERVPVADRLRWIVESLGQPGFFDA